MPAFIPFTEGFAMNIDTHPGLALYKANAALALRSYELLQENRQRWLEQGTGRVQETMAETRAEIAQLQESDDWQSLAALPGRALWRVLDRQMSNAQAALQTAIVNQAEFSAGWQQALGQWQQDMARALSQARDAMPVHATMLELLRDWGRVPGVAEPAAAPAKRLVLVQGSAKQRAPRA